MSRFVFFILFFIMPFGALFAQTRFYLALPDGTCDSSSYREIIQSSGRVITHDETTSFRSDTTRNFRMLVENNKIHGEFLSVPRGGKDNETVDVILGWVNEKREILDSSVQINGVASPSAFIRYSKVYGMDGNLMGYISGDPVYGAGLYLLHQ